MINLKKYSLCTVDGKIDSASRRSLDANAIGHISKFASKTLAHQDTTLRDFLDQLHKALAVSQVKIFFNEYGRCVGYVIWAFLSPDVERQFVQYGPRRLNQWEFNEGLSPWIIDFQILPGCLHFSIIEIKKNIFKDYGKVTYWKRRNGRFLLKLFFREHRPLA